MTTLRPAEGKTRRALLSSVGRRLSEGSPTARIARIMVAISTAALVAVCAGAAVTVATFDGRTERDVMRSPVSATEAETPLAWWSSSIAFSDGRYIDTVTIEPFASDAPLPAGLEAWPSPGGLIVSPAVANDPALSRLLTSLGTHVEGQIGRDGLTDDGERLVYSRPALGATPVWEDGLEISGYGAAHGRDFGTLGSALFARSMAEFLALYTVFALVPALVLMGAAARIGSERRDNRSALLSVLGARKIDIARVVIMDLGKPLIAGALFGTAIATVFMVRDVTLPGVGYVVRGGDVRAAWPTFILTSLVGVILAACLILVLNRPRKTRGSTRPTPASRPIRPRDLYLAPIVLVVGTIAIDQAKLQGESVLALTYYVVVLALLITLPGVVAGLTNAAARALLTLARRLGAPGSLSAARGLLVDPRGVTRISAALVVAILLAGQVQLWTTKLGSMALSAMELDDRVGGALITFSPPLNEAGGEAIDVVGEVAAPFVVRSNSGPDSPTWVTAQCGTLELLDIECVAGTAQPIVELSPSVRALVDLTGASAIVADPVNELDPDIAEGAGWSTWAAVSFDGSRVDVDALNTELRSLAAPRIRVVGLADSWHASASDMAAKGRWFTFLGGASVFLLGLAMSGALLAATAAVSAASSRWSALGAPRRTYVAIAFWRVLLPLVTATVASTFASVAVARPLLSPDQGGTLPVSTLVATASIAILVGVAGSIWVSRGLVRNAARWRPGRDD